MRKDKPIFKRRVKVAGFHTKQTNWKRIIINFYIQIELA
jgi:hypothetical protein